MPGTGAGAAVGTPGGLELRPVRPEELEAYIASIRRTFGGPHPTADELALRRETIDLDRTLAFFDQDDVVATAGIISYEMTVPGGASVPCGGVTRVSVLSTHRRRGLLRAMMRRQLDDMHERGEPLAALFASEAPIYGRFGYGLATYQSDLEIPHARGTFAQPVDPVGRVRLVDVRTALDGFPRVWDAARSDQPGMLRLDERGWRGMLSDREFEREGFSAHYLALYEAEGRPTGFAIYRIKMDWDSAGPMGILRVIMLLSASDDAYAALWRYLLDIDLIGKVTAFQRPTEEPLRFLLADSRQPKTTVEDGIWLRLVDVPRALEVRRYAVEGRLVVAVHDEFCPWNTGTFELNANPAGASCHPSKSAPDLEISVADLGSVYLGGNRFRSLHKAGRVLEKRPSAVGRADTMFTTDRVPWCPSHF